MKRGDRLKVVLSGMVAGTPRQGGAAWAVLQYLIGLRQLGHEVLLVEPVERKRLAGASVTDSASAAYFRRVPDLGAQAALLVVGTEETVGASYDDLRRFALEADLLLNISGMLADERLVAPIPVRAYVDLDPGFNQVWHETGEAAGFEGHTHFATVGLAVGSPACLVPQCGRSWITTLPPVVLERWPAAGAPERDAFTTVGHWRSYGSIEHDGVLYGQRAHSLRGLIELPTRTRARFELALGIHPDERGDLEALAANGWRLLDPLEVAAAPEDYAAFVRGSKAELGIAKSGYVASRSGGFSDRSSCYLASGRPVVAQNTGFSDYLPTGAGLLAFDDLDGALAGVDDVERDWSGHSRAARAVAEEHLDSRVVLTRLLERLGAVA